MRKTTMPRPLSRQAGITLLELLVVLVILALIAGFAARPLINVLSGAKADAAAIKLEGLIEVLDLYSLEVGHYPSEQDGLEALFERPPGAEAWNGPYVRKREHLLDPWNRLYLYRYPGDNGDFDLWSLGADGIEGGDDEDADVTSW
jgi:general secretion pathway protein G